MDKKPVSGPNKFFKFASVGIQMGFLIWLGSKAGKYLDAKYPMEKNWFTIGLVMLAVIISFYQLYKELPKE